jgi:AcrR family transcriptional regulator
MNERSFIIHRRILKKIADRESRKKRITAQRREQILKAALEVFSRKGFAAATIPEIAGQAGVAVGTIYLYYPGKRELFIAVIKNIIISAPLLNLINKIQETDIGTSFKDILQNRFDLIQSEQMSRMPALMGEVLRDPELKALWIGQFLQPLLSQLEIVYRLKQSPGMLRRIEPAVAVRAIGGLLFGFLMINLLEGESSPLNRLPQETVKDDMVNFILHGLLARPGEKTQQEDVA